LVFGNKLVASAWRYVNVVVVNHDTLGAPDAASFLAKQACPANTDSQLHERSDKHTSVTQVTSKSKAKPVSPEPTRPSRCSPKYA